MFAVTRAGMTATIEATQPSPTMEGYSLGSSHWEVNNLEILQGDPWQHALHVMLHLLYLTSHAIGLVTVLARPCHPEQVSLPWQPPCIVVIVSEQLQNSLRTVTKHITHFCDLQTGLRLTMFV